MRRSKGGFGGYRGRRTLNDVLKLVAVVLGVLVAALLAVLLLGQKYIVFTDQGLRLELPPFFQREESGPPEPGSVSVVVQPGNSGAPEDGSQTEEPPETRGMSALELPLGAVLNGTALEQLEQAGADALVLEMKDPQGKLNWVSQQGRALSAGVNSTAEGVNEGLDAWNRGGVYTVARVCCFRDNTQPYQDNGVALRATYGNWRDELGLRWLDPAKEGARAYVAGLCGELAQLGFDEIVLECAGFPAGGNLESITGGSDQPQQVVEQFLALAEQAVEPYGTVLSLRVERAALTGEDGLSGLTVPLLRNQGGRLWVEQDGVEPGLTQLLEDKGIAPERLVEVTASLEGESESARALLAENG